MQTNARLINHSGGGITQEAIVFLQKQEVTLWSLFGAAINHTIKTGQRALLLLKGNLSQTVKKLQRSTESLLAGLVEAPPPPSPHRTMRLMPTENSTWLKGPSVSAPENGR